MPYKNIFIDLIIDFLDFDVPIFPYESPYSFIKRKKQRSFSRSQYQQAVWKLQRRGFLKIIKKNNQRFIQLTGKGQLETLMRKAKIAKPKAWDGKWRVVIFDIPENSRDKRDSFRLLLKQNDFVKLQASVFVSPYPFNREAVLYLKQTGLMNYIRILRVDEMDEDKDLRKKFNLNLHHS